jgi:hypothetical protein
VESLVDFEVVGLEKRSECVLVVDVKGLKCGLKMSSDELKTGAFKDKVF